MKKKEREFRVIVFKSINNTNTKQNNTNTKKKLFVFQLKKKSINNI